MKYVYKSVFKKEMEDYMLILNVGWLKYSPFATCMLINSMGHSLESSSLEPVPIQCPPAPSHGQWRTFLLPLILEWQ